VAAVPGSSNLKSRSAKSNTCPDEPPKEPQENDSRVKVRVRQHAHYPAPLNRYFIFSLALSKQRLTKVNTSGSRTVSKPRAPVPCCAASSATACSAGPSTDRSIPYLTRHSRGQMHAQDMFYKKRRHCFEPNPAHTTRTESPPRSQFVCTWRSYPLKSSVNWCSTESSAFSKMPTRSAGAKWSHATRTWLRGWGGEKGGRGAQRKKR
jgi:hypothetical protein